MSSQREAVLGLSRVHEARTDLPTRFVHDGTDGFGDRLVIFDRGGAPAWEALRLRSDFMSAPGVGTALERRLDQLAGLDHPALPAVRLVDDPETPGGVLLLSAYTRGRCLSELDRPRSAAFAMTVIKDVLAPLAAMQKHGRAVTHGSLTAARVLVSPDGHLVVRDHPLGAVLDALALSPARLWSEFGVLRPGRVPVTGSRLDVIDTALIALSCLLGRPIGPDDYPGRVEALLEQHVLFPPLRQWLEAAFDVDDEGLSSAGEALDAASRLFGSSLPGEADVRASLAVFGRKSPELSSSPPLPVSPWRILADEGGTSFLPVRRGEAPAPAVRSVAPRRRGH